MKNLYRILYASLMALSITSCKKEFLEINPEQQAAVNVVVIDLPTTRAAVMGTYSILQGAAYYGRSAVVLPDLMADNMYISRRNSSRYTSYDQYITITNDGTASGSWYAMYRTIVNANIIISKGEQLSVPASEQAEVSHLVGEAYTMRALAHFDLLRFYAAPYNATANATHIGVPVISKSGTSKEDILNPKRNTVKEGYDLIVSDLKKALTLMPATPVGFTAANKGHISQFAAKALLARVYLYMEDWVNAEAMATDVIVSNKFTLLSNANYQSGSTNFRTQNNSEAIFEVVYNSTSNLGTDRLAAFLFQGSSYGDGLATDDLFNLYSAADVRKGFMTRGSRTSAENPANVITKYNNTTTFEEGVKVIRLSEVYLIRAEARAKQTGKDALAAADLDIVAKRADASAPTTVASGIALQNLILLENRKEFAFEGHRLFDLTRNKLGFTKYRTGGITIPIANNSLKTVLPIPLAEMNANTNMEQNEGYK
ncbi:RagB/SusD family nutrient uptake outer membrane protein [Pedobacter aquatilis]|uniref:RagB/SusD family nutrient uptake outer membrane protein n=1 Tax=Pedobacter aquatilis TaxID=351343 RepID=UPI0025B5009C|nr:RagB/SusD family nutrient uptake outer membrane protein [Pedobacter aquatilis]MDN3586468.1 RagB/SusD family nutrient uptake outer membrane protein [Pedobacter aquatilis]